MPHAELKYSADLEIDAEHVLRLIEERINMHDPKAGACKGRAYPAAIFHRTHLLVEIGMLTKPHRDAAFVRKVRDDIESAVKACLSQRCFFSLAITFSDEHYITNEFVPS
ncbi:MAG: hypothetical protein P8L32_03420 [Paracoccaceae bacterium]|jgi:hypothetical protein|nr:hypothetical protein [Paracoccaceae bacterium]